MALRETLEARKLVLDKDRSGAVYQRDWNRQLLEARQAEIIQIDAEVAEIDRVLATLPEPQPAIG